MNSMAPLGYTAVDLISLSRCAAWRDRLQNRCSPRTGQVTQLSMMFKPYGARIATSWVEAPLNPLGSHFNHSGYRPSLANTAEAGFPIQESASTCPH